MKPAVYRVRIVESPLEARLTLEYKERPWSFWKTYFNYWFRDATHQGGSHIVHRAAAEEIAKRDANTLLAKRIILDAKKEIL